MTRHAAPPAMSLFDLIARSWELGAPVRDIRFNVVGSSVAVTMEDGTMAFVQVRDAEAPETRMRTEVDSGRMTIRPRAQALPVPVRSDGPVAAPDHGLWQVAQQGFVFVHRDGHEIWRATARGLTVRVARAGAGPVTALSALPGKRGLLVARGRAVEVISPEDAGCFGAVELDHDVVRIAPAPGGARAACWGPGRVTILDMAGPCPVVSIATGGAAACLEWSADGRWLVGGCRDKALLVVDTEAATADRIVDFPGPVASVRFSGAAGAMLASGAFRVVGWRMPDLPFGAHEGTPVETGRPGLTLVERIAPHPLRDLCAAGYANGLVTLCQIGRREEMMLREGGGAPVTALEWSPDGTHLAIGTAGGQAAIATFPKAMFK